MSANLTPHWGLVIFLIVVYAISALMHLDPNIANPGGASTITAVTITTVDITLFVAAILAGIGAAVVLGILVGGWAGMGGFFGTFLAALAVTNSWAVLLLITSVVTFSNLGLPVELQFIIAAPCVVMLTWTILAFIAAITGIGADVKPGSSS